LVILDDKRARRIAHERGLALVGTLGVLVRAKGRGLLLAVRPVVDAMQQQGRHMSATLRAQVLQLVDETNDMHADG
jgi:predicted nucleic acid-binding protein